MFRQVVKVCLLVGSVSLVSRTSQGNAGGPAQAPVVSFLEATKLETMQRATVQLVLFSSADEAGDADLRATYGHAGLGTLVALGGNTYLFTHDHWGVLEAVVRVQILTFDGRLVGEIAGADFRRRILYRDGGTLILALPAFFGQSEGLRPVALGHVGTVRVGDRLLVAHQDLQEIGRVRFLPVEVVNQAVEAGLEALKLRSLTGEPVVRGDSGGGVWLNGKLIGNNWKTDVLVWGLALPGAGEAFETRRDTSLAARVSPLQVEALAPGTAAAGASDRVSLQTCLVEEAC